MKRVYRIKEEIRVALNGSWLHHCSCSSSMPRVTDGAAVKYQVALYVIILHRFQLGTLVFGLVWNPESGVFFSLNRIKPSCC